MSVTDEQFAALMNRLEIITDRLEAVVTAVDSVDSSIGIYAPTDPSPTIYDLDDVVKSLRAVEEAVRGQG